MTRSASANKLREMGNEDSQNVLLAEEVAAARHLLLRWQQFLKKLRSWQK
jgi:hypothetical protein